MYFTRKLSGTVNVDCYIVAQTNKSRIFNLLTRTLFNNCFTYFSHMSVLLSHTFITAVNVLSTAHDCAISFGADQKNAGLEEDKAWPGHVQYRKALILHASINIFRSDLGIDGIEYLVSLSAHPYFPHSVMQ